jgi:Lrp/AsnC family transcriptional regulator for asnA, asnC and gidA
VEVGNVREKRNGAELTVLERSIIRQLQDDGRVSYSAVGRALGVPEPTVRRSAQRLVEDGVISITAVGNPQVLGLAAMASLALTVNWPDVERLALSLLQIPSIDYVATTLGRFQVIAEVGAKDLNDLMRKVAIARALPGVKASETFVYLNLFHQEFRWPDPGGLMSSPERASAQAPTEIERRLIIALRDNGRRSFRRLARDLGVSERQVRSTYAGLAERGIVRVMAVVNPARLGLNTMAWLGIKVRAAVPVLQAAAAVAANERIDYLAICAGRYDMLAETACANDAELAEVVERQLGSLDAIEEIEVFRYVRLQYVNETVWSAGRVSALDA